jgi:hypothetical protein
MWIETVVSVSSPKRTGGSENIGQRERFILFHGYTAGCIDWGKRRIAAKRTTFQQAAANRHRLSF